MSVILPEGSGPFKYEDWARAALQVTLEFYRLKCRCGAPEPTSYEDIGGNLKLHTDECLFRRQVAEDRAYALRTAEKYLREGQ